MANILDVRGWDVLNVGGDWRHVNHALRLATSGWMTREACIRNANGYRDDAGTRAVMARRYAELFPTQEA